MVRRKKSTYFFDVKEDTTVLEIKKMIQGITQTDPEDQSLYYKNEILDDNKTLGDYNLNFATAKAQTPATIGLAFSSDDGLEITPLSKAPELPDVMKSSESAAGSSGAGNSGGSAHQSQSDLN